MNFLKNRLVASLLLLAVVFGITPVVAQGQLTGKVGEVEDFFSEDDAAKSVCTRLSERSNAAGNLVSIAAGYPDIVSETEALRFAQQEMASAIAEEDPEDLYHANLALEPAFQALYQKLDAESLSDTDRQDIEAYQTTFNGAQRMLVSTAQKYNDKVRAFRIGTYSHFPAQWFAQWFDIDPPKYFSADGNVYPSTEELSAQAETAEVPEVPQAPDAPEAPEAPDLEKTINNFVDGITDYVNYTVQDALDDAFEQ